MARRRRVSYRGKDGIVSFLYKNSKQEKEIKARQSRLKREIVKEILNRIYNEDYLSKITDGDGGIDPDVQCYWDEYGENEVRKAARLAIELWENRR